MKELTTEEYEMIGNRFANILIAQRDEIIREKGYTPYTADENEAYRSAVVMGTTAVISNLIMRDAGQFMFGTLLHELIELHHRLDAD